MGTKPYILHSLQKNLSWWKDKMARGMRFLGSPKDYFTYCFGFKSQQIWALNMVLSAASCL